VAAADAARAASGRATYRAAAVTERKTGAAREDGGMVARTPGDGGGAGAMTPDAVDITTAVERGTEWGTAVHDALQYAAQGLDGDALRLACRNRLVALERELDSAGEPVELDELIGVVAAVRTSGLWRRAERARRVLVEVPFAVRFTAAEYAAVMAEAADAPPVEIVEGRIDLAFQEDDGWVIVDYKSDAAGEAAAPALLRGYRAQLRLYEAAWARLTGEPVKEATLLFTATVAAT
jgi:ATP-dependent helicase/nuclease subunit A